MGFTEPPSTYSLDEETNVGGSLCIHPVVFPQECDAVASGPEVAQQPRESSDYLAIVNAKHLIEYRLFLYESIEAARVIAVISWMAGMLYLPRQVMPAPFL